MDPCAVDTNVSNVVSIAIAVSGNLAVTADVSNESGLSQIQVAGITPVATNGRVPVTVNGIRFRDSVYGLAFALLLAGASETSDCQSRRFQQ